MPGRFVFRCAAVRRIIWELVGDEEADFVVSDTPFNGRPGVLFHVKPASIDPIED